MSAKSSRNEIALSKRDLRAIKVALCNSNTLDIDFQAFNAALGVEDSRLEFNRALRKIGLIYKDKKISKMDSQAADTLAKPATAVSDGKEKQATPEKALTTKLDGTTQHIAPSGTLPTVAKSNASKEPTKAKQSIKTVTTIDIPASDIEIGGTAIDVVEYKKRKLQPVAQLAVQKKTRTKSTTLGWSTTGASEPGKVKPSVTSRSKSKSRAAINSETATKEAGGDVSAAEPSTRDEIKKPEVVTRSLEKAQAHSAVKSYATDQDDVDTVIPMTDAEADIIKKAIAKYNTAADAATACGDAAAAEIAGLNAAAISAGFDAAVEAREVADKRKEAIATGNIQGGKGLNSMPVPRFSDATKSEPIRQNGTTRSADRSWNGRDDTLEEPPKDNTLSKLENHARILENRARLLAGGSARGLEYLAIPGDEWNVDML